MIKTLLLMVCMISVSHAKTYTVAFPNNEFYPQYEEDTKLGAKGFLPEILRKFALDNKINLKFRFLPIKRYMEYLKNGQIDFVIPDNPSWANDAKKDLPLKYSNEVMKSRVGVIVRDQDIDIKKSELKTLGTVSGYTIHQFDQELSSGLLNVKYNINPLSLLKQVSLKRVQGAYFHIDIALHLSKQLSKKLVVAKQLPTIDYSYHLSTVKHPAVINAFDKWMKSNETWLKKTRDSYLSTNSLTYPLKDFLALKP